MASKVHMIYTGIIAIVPAAHPSGAMYMCMPAGHGHQDPKTRHKPHLVAEKNQITTDLDAIDPKTHGCSDLEAPSHLSAYSIEGSTMAIASRVVAEPLYTRFDYFLDLASGCSPVYPSCERFNMGKLIHTQDAGVVAKTLITDGTLEASYVDKYYQWEFVDPVMGNAKWIAQELVHTFEIEDDELKLSFGMEGILLSAVVRPPGSSAIEVRIGNTLCEDIFPKYRNPTTWPPEDTHVRMYHDLSAVPTPVGQRRKLVPRRPPKALSKPPQADPKHQYRLSGGTLAKAQGGLRGSEEKWWTVGGANCPPALFRS